MKAIDNIVVGAKYAKIKAETGIINLVNRRTKGESLSIGNIVEIYNTGIAEFPIEDGVARMVLIPRKEAVKILHKERQARKETV